jgi:hypothetical protein
MYLEYSQSVLSSCSNHQLPQSLTRRRKLYFVVFYMVVHVLSAVFASYSCSAFVFAEWFDFDPLFSSQSTHRLNCSSGIYLMMLLDNFYSCWLDGGRSCISVRHIICTCHNRVSSNATSAPIGDTLRSKYVQLPHIIRIGYVVCCSKSWLW